MRATGNSMTEKCSKIITVLSTHTVAILYTLNPKGGGGGGGAPKKFNR